MDIHFIAPWKRNVLTVILVLFLIALYRPMWFGIAVPWERVFYGFLRGTDLVALFIIGCLLTLWGNSLARRMLALTIGFGIGSIQLAILFGTEEGAVGFKLHHLIIAGGLVIYGFSGVWFLRRNKHGQSQRGKEVT